LKEEVEILKINVFTTCDWRNPLFDYLQNLNLFMDWKIKYKVINYVIIGDALYEKGIDGVLLKCLGELEAYITLVETHEGNCGYH